MVICNLSCSLLGFAIASFGRQTLQKLYENSFNTKRQIIDESRLHASVYHYQHRPSTSSGSQYLWTMSKTVLYERGILKILRKQILIGSDEEVLSVALILKAAIREGVRFNPVVSRMLSRRKVSKKYDLRSKGKLNREEKQRVPGGWGLWSNILDKDGRKMEVEAFIMYPAFPVSWISAWSFKRSFSNLNRQFCVCWMFNMKKGVVVSQNLTR